MHSNRLQDFLSIFYLNFYVYFAIDSTEYGIIIFIISLYLLIDKMKVKTQDLANQVNNSLSSVGQFEWVDGTLVDCLKEGHWLLIQNVNFCR